MTPAAPQDLRPLASADRAERTGDLAGAAAFLRAHLARTPEDGPSRLRLARLLHATGEGRAARHALAGLEEEVALAADAHALFAEIAEGDGRIAAAADHWERVLAYRFDHPQARARLRALRGGTAAREVTPPPDLGSAPTFVSPEGVRAMRWRLLRELGRGANATVYLARDESLGIDLALKVLHPQLGSPQSESCRRFFAEARTAASLRHPGVVAIYDLDEATRSLAMEYVAGGTLKQRLARGPLEPGEALSVARSLLGALAFVHERGVTHGDLKPSNLLLRRAGEVVLADFGIARAAGTETRGEQPAGTPLYLAPEQFRGAPASPFTDMFAAGAILWETLAGRPLRTRADLGGDARLAPLPQQPPELEPLGTLVGRLVAQDASERPPSAAFALGQLGSIA